jgi:UPF0176 protein
MQLYNTLSAEERRVLIEKAGDDRLTISFYQYAHIKYPQELRDKLFINWEKLDVLGRTYIATEGINAQISLPAKNLETFKNELYAIDFMNGIRLNVAIEHDSFSFLKNKIKIRKKIVADGLEDNSFDVTDIGVHLRAKDFNSIIEDKNTVLVDMRNHYESEIGHFEGALTPDVDTFRDSLDIIEEDLKEHKEDKNIVMYCTGGIRCEKASAYYKHKGFKNVYQLEGGIIEYARQVKEENLDNKFLGKNFVFDHRKSERISNDVVSNCHQCGKPCDNHVNCLNKGCHLLFIQCDSCKNEMLETCSDDCKSIVQLSEEEQKALRKGKTVSNKVFRKGRTDKLEFSPTKK